MAKIDWTGATALQVAQHIIRSHPEVRNVQVVHHPVGRNWRQIHTIPETQCLHWESGLADSTDDPRKVVHIEPTEFVRDTILEKLSPRLGEGEVFSINSRAIIGTGDANVRHIPMMNFHWDAILPVGYLFKIIRAITMDQPGFVLNSGRFCHYYGNFLLSQREWEQFLGDFSMLCFLVSPRYLGHSLRRGYCSLRLTAEPVHKPEIPTVIAYW